MIEGQDTTPFPALSPPPPRPAVRFPLVFEICSSILFRGPSNRGPAGLTVNQRRAQAGLQGAPPFQGLRETLPARS